MYIVFKITYLMLISYFGKFQPVFSLDWSEEKFFDSEQDIVRRKECSDELHGICNKEYNTFDILHNIFFNTKLTDHDSEEKRTPVSPLYDMTNNTPCQCGMTYRIMDLGSGIYPRYIHTGICKKNTCGLFHRCQSKKYKIRLLRRRDPDVDLLDDHQLQELVHVPEALAGEWVSDQVNIVIACECIPIKI